MTQGFAALSHRTVAQQAALPLAATTYYFATLDDLVAGAVQHLADTWLATARDTMAQLPEQLGYPEQTIEAVLSIAAPAPVDVGAVAPGALITLYDRYLEAARHPELRPAIERYNGAIDVLLVGVLRRGGMTASLEDARLVLAVIDGALLRALAEGRPVSSVHPPLRHLLLAMAAATRS